MVTLKLIHRPEDLEKKLSGELDEVEKEQTKIYKLNFEKDFGVADRWKDKKDPWIKIYEHSLDCGGKSFVLRIEADEKIALEIKQNLENHYKKQNLLYTQHHAI